MRLFVYTTDYLSDNDIYYYELHGMYYYCDGIRKVYHKIDESSLPKSVLYKFKKVKNTIWLVDVVISLIQHRVYIPFKEEKKWLEDEYYAFNGTKLNWKYDD